MFRFVGEADIGWSSHLVAENPQSAAFHLTQWPWPSNLVIVSHVSICYSTSTFSRCFRKHGSAWVTLPHIHGEIVGGKNMLTGGGFSHFLHTWTWILNVLRSTHWWQNWPEAVEWFTLLCNSGNEASTIHTEFYIQSENDDFQNESPLLGIHFPVSHAVFEDVVDFHQVLQPQMQDTSGPFKPN